MSTTLLPYCITTSSASSVSTSPFTPKHAPNSDSLTATAALSQKVALSVVIQVPNEFVRVEEHEFSDSEDETPPVYLHLDQDLIKALHGLSVTSASPTYKAHESSDSSSLSPRAQHRRRQYRSWSHVVTDFAGATAKKARTLSPGSTSRSNATEEKTPRALSEEPANSYFRRSVKRCRNGD